MRSVSLAVLAIVSFSFLTGCDGSGFNKLVFPSTSTSITVAINGAVTPTTGVVQVDGGDWTPLTLDGSSATFSVPQTSSTYAIAFVCPTGSAIQFETVFEATASDTATPATSCVIPGGTGVQTVSQVVNFNVAAVGGTNASVFIGTSGDSFVNSPASSATLIVVPGTQDVAVVAYGNSVNNGPLGVEIMRGVDVTGATITALAMSVSDETGSEPLTVGSVPSGYTGSANEVYITAGGTQTILSIAPTNYATIAAADSMAGDFYALQVEASNTSAGINNILETFQSFGTPQPATLTLPAAVNYSGPTPASYPVFNLNYNDNGFTVAGGTTGSIAAEEWATGPSAGNVIYVFSTSSYNASNPVSIPNLSSVPGFFGPPTSGSSVFWGVGAFSETALYFVDVDPIIPQNENAQIIEVSGTFTEP